jgi:hypothetical protein
MKKLFLFLFLLSFLARVDQVRAQDNYALELNVGLLHNNSLFLGEALNSGAALGLEYYIDRNIFAGLNASYLMAGNEVSFNPYAFNSSLSYSGSSFVLKENLTRLQVGAVAGYRFFPLRYVSISLGLQFNYLSLRRSFNDPLPVQESAVNWLDQSYSSGSVTCPGGFLNIAFNVGRKTSLYLGVQSSDLTNTLFADKDAGILERVSYADGKIVEVFEREQTYNPLDLKIGVIFKFANRKF